MAWASYQGLRIMMVISGRWARLGSFSALDYYSLGNYRRFAQPLRKIRSLAPPTLGPFPAISFS